MRRLGLEVVVAAGFVALALLGEPLDWLAGVGWALCGVGGMAPQSWRERLPWGALTAAWILMVAALVWLRVSPVVGLGLVLWWLQLHRRVSRYDGADDRVATVLAGLMVVAAAGVVQSVAFLVPAVLFAASLPLALLPEGRAGRGWGWLPVHVVVTVLCFATLPRPAAEPPATPTTRLTGFAPDVELGALDPLLDDPGVVFRARMQGAPDRVYWRGLALDAFDGVRWYSTTPPLPVTVAGVQGVAVDVTLAQATDGVIFVPGALTGLDVEGVRSDQQGGWFLPAQDRPQAFRMYVSPREEGDAWFDEPSVDLARWLQLPGSLDPDVRSLAQRVAGEGSDTERVERLASWLEEEVEYTRDGRAGSEHPLEDFLLADRRGHCEFVAAGLAVMARAADHPARVVNGFASSERDPVTGDLVVRRQHAHAWTEVLIDGRWVVFDATPSQVQAPPVPAWRRMSDTVDAWWQTALVAYDRHDQREVVWASARAVEGWLRLPEVPAAPWRGGVVLLALGIGAGWALRVGAARWLRGLDRRSARVQQGPIARQHARAREALRSRGHAPPPALPPVAAAQWLAERVPEEVGGAMIALAWLYYEVALGEGSSGERAAEARALAERVVQGPHDQGTSTS